MDRGRAGASFRSTSWSLADRQPAVEIAVNLATRSLGLLVFTDHVRAAMDKLLDRLDKSLAAEDFQVRRPRRIYRTFRVVSRRYARADRKAMASDCILLFKAVDQAFQGLRTNAK